MCDLNRGAEPKEKIEMEHTKIEYNTSLFKPMFCEQVFDFVAKALGNKPAPCPQVCNVADIVNRQENLPPDFIGERSDLGWFQRHLCLRQWTYSVARRSYPDY